MSSKRCSATDTTSAAGASRPHDLPRLRHHQRRDRTARSKSSGSVVDSGKPLSELKKVLKKYPQAQRNLRVREKPPVKIRSSTSPGFSPPPNPPSPARDASSCATAAEPNRNPPPHRGPRAGRHRRPRRQQIASAIQDAIGAWLPQAHVVGSLTRSSPCLTLWLGRPQGVAAVCGQPLSLQGVDARASDAATQPVRSVGYSRKASVHGLNKRGDLIEDDVDREAREIGACKARLP